MLQKQEQTILDGVTPVAIVSSTDATPIVVTATGHGFITGDRVLIYGHTTNIAANGIYKVVKVTNDTFQLKDELTGADVVGSGAGAGANGICLKAPIVVFGESFRNIELQISTSGTATTTIKMVASQGKPASQSTTSPRYDLPNFGATVSPSNPYSFVQVIDLSDGSAKDGVTGIVVAGTDINNIYEVNTNSLKYFIPLPVSWTAGAITIKALLVNY